MSELQREKQEIHGPCKSDSGTVASDKNVLSDWWELPECVGAAVSQVVLEVECLCVSFISFNKKKKN